MGKKAIGSSVRIQVIIDKREQAAFKSQARAAGMSLSAWLREAGRERLRESAGRARFRNRDELQAFFQACDEREGGSREPDWSEHLQVIGQSHRQGLPDV